MLDVLLQIFKWAGIILGAIGLGVLYLFIIMIIFDWIKESIREWRNTDEY